MDPSAGREQQLKYGGFLVAGVGFLLSRGTLLVVADPGGSTVRFLTTGLVPLVLGLALTAFGVSLAVSTFEPWYVNVVALWTLVGTAGMGLVTALSLVNPMLAEDAMLATAQSGTLVANTLIGGAVGGSLIGVRSARNRRQRRELARQSDQVVVLDRILRDEVLNAVTAIHARAEVLRHGGTDEDSLDSIDRATDRIRAAVEDVGFLIKTHDSPTGQEPTPLAPALREELAAVADQQPGATLEWTVDVDDDLAVRANDRLGTVFGQLCATAVERHPEGAPLIRVSVGATDTAATVTVTDDGDPLTEKQAAVLASDTISEYDDPAISFGYPIVSFLVDQYGGDVTVARDGGQTRVTVSLPRVRESTVPSKRHGVEPVALRDVTVAALLAGVAMGTILQVFANTIPVIGSLYGVASLPVGWVTHLFHSVVFGVFFAAALRRPSLSVRVDSLATTVAVAVGFGLLLAVGVAGLVMPLWLNAVGVSAPLPRVFPAGVVGHVVWGIVLGSVYWALSRR